MSNEIQPSSELDQIDGKILDLLVDNARISITEMSRIIGLSKTPCTIRMQRLIDEGYIEAFRAVLNPKKLGLDHVAFAEVKLSDTKEKALSEFNRAVRKIK